MGTVSQPPFPEDACPRDGHGPPAACFSGFCQSAAFNLPARVGQLFGVNLCEGAKP